MYILYIIIVVEICPMSLPFSKHISNSLQLRSQFFNLVSLFFYLEFRFRVFHYYFLHRNVAKTSVKTNCLYAKWAHTHLGTQGLIGNSAGHKQMGRWFQRDVRTTPSSASNSPIPLPLISLLSIPSARRGQPTSQATRNRNWNLLPPSWQSPQLQMQPSSAHTHTQAHARTLAHTVK